MPMKHSAEDNRKVVILSALIIIVFSFIFWQRNHAGEADSRPALDTGGGNVVQPVSDSAVSSGMMRIPDKELDGPAMSQMPPEAKPDVFRPLSGNSSSAEASSGTATLPPALGGSIAPELLPAPAGSALALVPMKPLQPRLTVSVVLDGVSIDDKEQLASFTFGKQDEPLQGTLECGVGDKIGASKVTAIEAEGVLLAGNHTLWRIGDSRSVVWMTPAQPLSAPLRTGKGTAGKAK